MIKSNHGFTLVEIIVASAISVMVLAGISAVFFTSLEVWTVGSTDVRLERTGSLLLERIVRGASGMYGLREANSDSVTIDPDSKHITYSVDKNDPPTYVIDDDTTVRIYHDKAYRRLMYDPDTSVGGDEFEISLNGVVEDISFTSSGNRVNIEVLLSDNVVTPDKTVQTRFNTSVVFRKTGQI